MQIWPLQTIFWYKLLGIGMGYFCSGLVGYPRAY